MHALKAAHAHCGASRHQTAQHHGGPQWRAQGRRFWIAHVADENMSTTKTGSVMGTLGYMAPEQRASARDVDARADLYRPRRLVHLDDQSTSSDLFAVDLDETMFQAVPERLRR